MKPADRHSNAGIAKPRGQIHRPWKLVRLHADEADEAGFCTLDPPDDPVDRDHRVALVIGPDLDRDLGAECLALSQIRRDAVKTSERVRRDPGFPPLDHIAVVVVMRRLDQLDDKPAVPQRGFSPRCCASLPCATLAKKGLPVTLADPRDGPPEPAARGGARGSR